MNELRKEDFRIYVEDFDTKTDGWQTDYKAYSKALEAENKGLREWLDDKERLLQNAETENEAFRKESKLAISLAYASCKAEVEGYKEQARALQDAVNELTVELQGVRIYAAALLEENEKLTEAGKK